MEHERWLSPKGKPSDCCTHTEVQGGRPTARRLPWYCKDEGSGTTAGVVAWPRWGFERESEVMCFMSEILEEPSSCHLPPMGMATKLCMRVHEDYARCFIGHMFLIIAHAHSKWMEVHLT